MYSTIISTAVLEENIANKDYILLDCRSDLLNPDWGYLDYSERHIRGAIYIDLNKDLSSPITPNTGRHPLPDPNRFVETIAKFGIEPQKQVVVIDTANGTIAARIWWLLRGIGHRSVAVLDGGMNKWLNEKKETLKITPQIHATLFRYPFRFSSKPYINTKAMENLILNPAYLMLDARSPERFRGEIEPIDSVAGHIPGAKNRWMSDNLNPDGSFKSQQALIQEFKALLMDRDAQHVISYCGSGVTACHNLLALEIAVFGEAILYPGSWSEWIRNPAHPIEKEPVI